MTFGPSNHPLSFNIYSALYKLQVRYLSSNMSIWDFPGRLVLEGIKDARIAGWDGQFAMKCVLLLPLALLSYLVSCEEITEDKGLGLDHHEHGHRRRHCHRHRLPCHRHRLPCHRHHRECHHDRPCPPPCDLSICTTKIGNFTMITRPVPLGQTAGACASIGMRVAQINIENFMDATKMAFQCSGPFSQSWVASWNGDSYGCRGLVLSTGSAAPGGAINEVSDGNVPRNVLCEVCDEKIEKPECHGGHVAPDCGCERPSPCGCNRAGPVSVDPNALHGKMRCLRCFCRNSVPCPLLGGQGRGRNPGQQQGFGGQEGGSHQGFGGEQPSIGQNIVPTVLPTSTGSGRDPSRPVGPSNTGRGGRPTGKIENKAIEALKAAGRFFVADSKEIEKKENGKKQKMDGDDDGEDYDQMVEGQIDEDNLDDENEDYGDEEYQIDQMEFDGEKGLPFLPGVCGSNCVCYACKDFVQRHHHRRCHRHHHHHRCHHDLEEEKSKDNKDAAVAMKALRSIVAFDIEGKEVDLANDEALRIEVDGDDEETGSEDDGCGCGLDVDEEEEDKKKKTLL